MSEAKLPPHDAQAEMAVLGAMVRENGVIDDLLREGLQPENFYKDAHQKICTAVVALFDAGKPIDLVMLADELKSRKQIEDIGGYAYLGQLWDAAPTSANAVHYGGIVRKHWTSRLTILKAGEILQNAWDQVMEPGELLEQAEREFFEAARSSSPGKVADAEMMVQEVCEFLDEREVRRREGRPPDGVPSGFIDLDRITCGFRDAEFTVIGARPNVGKTALGLAVAGHAAIDQGMPVLFCSLEQRRAELMGRLLCSRAEVDGQVYRTGFFEDADWERLRRSADVIRHAPLFVDDFHAQTMMRIAGTARRYRSQKRIRLLMVDYLQLIEAERVKGSRPTNRQEEVAAISRRLKYLARDLQIPVVVLAQLNRQSTNRSDKRPQLSDLRESGAIEADADTVMLLHKDVDDDKDEPDVQEIQVYVAKQRNGPTGKLRLIFRRRFTKFENYAPAREDVFSRNGQASA